MNPYQKVLVWWTSSSFHLLQPLDLTLVLLDGLLPHHDLLLVLLQLVLLIVQLDAQTSLLGLKLQAATRPNNTGLGLGGNNGRKKKKRDFKVQSAPGCILTASWRSRSAS